MSCDFFLSISLSFIATWRVCVFFFSNTSVFVRTDSLFFDDNDDTTEHTQEQKVSAFSFSATPHNSFHHTPQKER